MSDKIRAYKGQYGTLEVEKLHMGKYVSFMIEDAGRKVIMNLPPAKVKSLAGSCLKMWIPKKSPQASTPTSQ